jgi:hypothetical protein
MLLVGLPHVLHVVLSAPLRSVGINRSRRICLADTGHQLTNLDPRSRIPVRLQANTHLSQFLMGIYPNSGPRLGAKFREEIVTRPDQPILPSSFGHAHSFDVGWLAASLAKRPTLSDTSGDFLFRCNYNRDAHPSHQPSSPFIFTKKKSWRRRMRQP